MVAQRYGLGSDWMDEYFKFLDPSEPKDEYKDRNLLYAMYAIS